MTLDDDDAVVNDVPATHPQQIETARPRQAVDQAAQRFRGSASSGIDPNVRLTDQAVDVWR